MDRSTETQEILAILPILGTNLTDDSKMRKIMEIVARIVNRAESAAYEKGKGEGYDKGYATANNRGYATVYNQGYSAALEAVRVAMPEEYKPLGGTVNDIIDFERGFNFYRAAMLERLTQLDKLKP